MTNYTYAGGNTFSDAFAITRYDSDGVATGDSVSAKLTGSAVRFGNGNGTSDSLVGTSGADLIAWDDYTTDHAGGTLNDPDEYYLFQNSSQRRQIDSIFGGAGDDVISLTFEKSGERYWEWDVDAGGANVRMAVDGGTGDDVIWGHVPSETLYGGADNDWIDGGGGNDRMYGGTGNDSLWGGEGADLAYGGAGDDWLLDVDSASSNDNTFTGDEGDDVVAAFGGADTLDGGVDNDAIWGGAGIDTIFGGEGEDYLYGGAGKSDVVYGGKGDDWFYFSRDDGAATLSDSGGSNTLVVFGGFATSGDDWFVKGTGVSDGNGGKVGDELGGKEANVSIAYGKDGAFTLTILDGVDGPALTTASGDADEIGRIVLWNSDNTTPGQTQELFVWNGSAFLFAGYEG